MEKMTKAQKKVVAETKNVKSVIVADGWVFIETACPDNLQDIIKVEKRV